MLNYNAVVLRPFFSLLFACFLLTGMSAQDSHVHGDHDNFEDQDEIHGDTKDPCATIERHEHGHDSEFNPALTAFHHISDQNVFSIGPFNFPLPVIVYAPGEGWDFFMSGKFGFDRFGHGNGHYAYNGYVLHEAVIKRIADQDFPDGKVDLGGLGYIKEDIDDAEKERAYACVEGIAYPLYNKSTMDMGIFGGGITNFYDFSLTKNVVTMILVALLLGWLFTSIAKKYKTRDGFAPNGVQSFIEPVFIFIQDEVAKPFLGDNYMKYLPLLMSLFFFILVLNLVGQVPFFGNPNASGNLAVTMALALIAFIVTNINGNRHYWQHVFAMPGVPKWVLIILTPVEILGLFIKPLTLMLRLFANITAGHIVVLVFVGLIFIFGNSGDSMGGTIAGTLASVPLTMFMMALELLVALIQAFVFTILTASYIGAAIEEHH